MSIDTPSPEAPQATKEKNNLGVIALVLGLLGIFPLSILAGIPALVVGIKSRKAAKEGRATNGQFGLAGIIAGAASIGIFLLFVLIGAFAGGSDDEVISGPTTSDVEEVEPAPEPAEVTPSSAPEPTSTPEPEPTSEPEATSEPEPTEEASEDEGITAGVGEAVEAGDFSYVVNDVNCGESNIGGEFGENAQGQFCLVDLSVTNVSDSAGTFFSSDVVMVNDSGQQFSADDVAGIYVEGNDAFLSQINPGNTLEGVVVYDIPADVTPSALEFSGGFFSEPVRVIL